MREAEKHAGKQCFSKGRDICRWQISLTVTQSLNSSYKPRYKPMPAHPPFSICKTFELSKGGSGSVPELSTVLERQLKFQSSSISPLLLFLFFHALTKEAPNGVASNCADFIFHSDTIFKSIKDAGSSGSSGNPPILSSCT